MYVYVATPAVCPSTNSVRHACQVKNDNILLLLMSYCLAPNCDIRYAHAWLFTTLNSSVFCFWQVVSLTAVRFSSTCQSSNPIWHRWRLINDDRRFRSRNFHGQLLTLRLLTTLNATFLAHSWMSSMFSFRVGWSWFIMLVVYKILFNINNEEFNFGWLSFGLLKTRPFLPSTPIWFYSTNDLWKIYYSFCKPYMYS